MNQHFHIFVQENAFENVACRMAAILPWPYIPVMSLWARRRHKSAASRLFTQPFVQAQIEENIKAPRHWPLWRNSPVTGEFPTQRASNAKIFPFDDVIYRLFSPSLLAYFLLLVSWWVDVPFQALAVMGLGCLYWYLGLFNATNLLECKTIYFKFLSCFATLQDIIAIQICLCLSYH